MVTTGIYHKRNVLKFRILLCLAGAVKGMTTRDIEADIGVPYTNISTCIHDMRRFGSFYIRKGPKKGKGKLNRWFISNNGIRILHQYASYLRYGLDLNISLGSANKKIVDGTLRDELPDKSIVHLLKLSPEQINTYLANYVGITYVGSTQMGIDQSNLIENAGLIKQFSALYEAEETTA